MTAQEPCLLVSASAIDFLLLDLLQSSDPMKATGNSRKQSNNSQKSY